MCVCVCLCVCVCVCVCNHLFVLHNQLCLTHNFVQQNNIKCSRKSIYAH